jgi:RNA polymerase sigma-70 factor (ECF subfamily)
LKSSGAEQADAITDLRAYVLRAAMHALRRSRGNLGRLASTEVNQLAEDCAQDALLAILQHLDEFRGESRFTTWVYSFAIDNPHLDEWTAGEGRAPADPHRRTLQRETLAVIRETVDHHLSDRQQQALKAIFFEGVPLDEIARHWGSNRNAVYKLLHDARRKLKAHLEGRGFGVKETLDLFGGER